MARIRLIGLLLFITAITLALAAAATRTTHVQVNSQWLRPFSPPRAQREPVEAESSTTIPGYGSTPPLDAGGQPIPSSDEPPAEIGHTHNWDYAAHQSHIELTGIPIAWPLLGTGAAGLLLWFIQPPSALRSSPKKRSARRRRRR